MVFSKYARKIFDINENMRKLYQAIKTTNDGRERFLFTLIE